MPELPEVETIRRGLENRLVGRRIRGVEGHGGRLTRNNPGGVDEVKAALEGSAVTAVERRGKFMWWILDGPADSLVVHLGMSGQVRTSTPESAAEPLGKHEHLRLQLDDGSAVHFVDPRMFGQITVSDLTADAAGRAVPAVASHIAPDLLEIDSGEEIRELARRLRSRERFIKTMLLDQNIVSGVGNIYADEGLFSAGVHGARPGSKLSLRSIRTVIEECRDVMVRAVEVGGTSFDSLYVDVEGNPGYFERELFVYGREDEPCRACGSLISRATLQGRSHFYCRKCQSVPRAWRPQRPK